MRYHLVSISSDICEDSFEEGEGDSTGAGVSVKVGRTFESLELLVKYMADHYGLSTDVNDYDDNEDGELQTDRSCANHSEAQNGGWMDPTEEEIEQWKAGRIKLYNEHYIIEYLRVA